MRVYALGACHAQCPWCARSFWAWVKARAEHNPIGVAGWSSNVPGRKPNNQDHFQPSIARIVP